MTLTGQCDVLQRIIAAKVEAGRMAWTLTRLQNALFPPDTIVPPKLIIAELGFIRLTSWLFMTCHERGRAGIRFLLEQPGNPEAIREANEHFKSVAELRTYLHHYINLDGDRDVEIAHHCATWFREACGSSFPDEEELWRKCLSVLLSKSLHMFEVFKSVVYSIDGDASREEICRIWASRIRRYRAPADFDPIVAEVLNNLGQNGIDAVRLRKRFYQQWTTHLEMRKEGYDFVVEARRLVEATVLSELAPILPIDGLDIRREFDLVPGPAVRQYLKKARQLYGEQPTLTAEELLAHLHESDTNKT